MKEIKLIKIHNYDLNTETDEYIYLKDGKEVLEKEYATVYYCKHLVYERTETFYFDNGWSTKTKAILLTEEE